MKEVKVSFLFNNEMDATVVVLQSGGIGVPQLVAGALSQKLAAGASLDVATLVVFDMATYQELAPDAASIGKANHIGFYPKDQTFLPDATPESMGKIFRLVPQMARDLKSQM
jgi:hypothetical protein